jgi:hypothetical protein
MGQARLVFQHHVMGHLAQYLLRRPSRALQPFPPASAAGSAAAARSAPFVPATPLEEAVLLLLVQGAHIVADDVKEPDAQSVARYKDALIFALGYVGDTATLTEVVASHMHVLSFLFPPF